MTDAPDPGLTDLIEAHRFIFTVTGRPNGCQCGRNVAPRDHAAHVALVVEQHTNGRITELEDGIMRAIHELIETRDRAEKAEATIARVEKLQRDLFQQGGNLIAQWGAARLIRAALQEEFIRAALEGEQQ